MVPLCTSGSTLTTLYTNCLVLDHSQLQIVPMQLLTLSSICFPSDKIGVTLSYPTKNCCLCGTPTGALSSCHQGSEPDKTNQMPRMECIFQPEQGLCYASDTIAIKGLTSQDALVPNCTFQDKDSMITTN